MWLDAQGKPLRLEKIENDISHQLIEELMLLANELIARELMRRRQPSIYRIHEKPDADKLLEFREAALIHGIECGDLSHRPELEKLLSRHSREAAGIRNQTRTPQEPETRPIRPATDGHYGLNKANYTHFYQPDPSLLRPRGSPRLGAIARTLKTRSGFLDAALHLRTPLDDRTDSGGRRKTR